MSNNHISRTATIILNDAPDKILPLFTAYGETLWVPGWNPQYVYPQDGEAIANSVWTTQHEEGAPETVWVTINYDAEAHSVTYVNVTPHDRVTRIDIQCDAIADGKTSAQVTYTITALGEQGLEHIEQLTQEHYDQWMQGSWVNSVNYYLENGEMIS